MPFLPHIIGEFAIELPASDFISSFQQRVENGLLAGQPGPRSNYEVVSSTDNSVHVRAADWSTAINVGLNDFELDLAPNGKLRYDVRYWRWLTYCVGLCALIGFVGAAFFLWLDLPDYIAANPTARLPGFTVMQTVYFAWSNLVFWAFAWPWILVLLHKRALRRLLGRIVSEVDSQASVRS